MTKAFIKLCKLYFHSDGYEQMWI